MLSTIISYLEGRNVGLATDIQDDFLLQNTENA